MTTVTRSIGDYLLSNPNESNQTMNTATATNEATSDKATNPLSGAVGRKIAQAHETFVNFARRVGDGAELKDSEADELLDALPLIGKLEADFVAAAAARKAARDNANLATELPARLKTLAAAAKAHAEVHVEVECAVIRAEAMLAVTRHSNTMQTGIHGGKLYDDTKAAVHRLRYEATAKLAPLALAHSNAASAVRKADKAARAVEAVRRDHPEMAVGL